MDVAAEKLNHRVVVSFFFFFYIFLFHYFKHFICSHLVRKVWLFHAETPSHGQIHDDLINTFHKKVDLLKSKEGAGAALGPLLCSVSLIIIQDP